MVSWANQIEIADGNKRGAGQAGIRDARIQAKRGRVEAGILVPFLEIEVVGAEEKLIRQMRIDHRVEGGIVILGVHGSDCEEIR